MVSKMMDDVDDQQTCAGDGDEDDVGGLERKWRTTSDANTLGRNPPGISCIIFPQKWS